MTEEVLLKDLIARMDRDILNAIVFSLAESNPEIENMIRNYSDGTDGIYKAICEQIKQVETAYKKYDWSDVDIVDDEMGKILRSIRGFVFDATIGIDLLKKFFELDYSVCENFDTDGGLEMIFDEASVLFSHYAEFFPDKNKLENIITDLVSNDNYGCRAKLSNILVKMGV